MDWIKIAPGCEMPEEGERLLVLNSYDWEEAEWADGYFSVPGGGEEIRGVTHFMRITRPS